MTQPARPASGTARPRWLGIQYLRGLAACGVVVFHYFDGPLAPPGTAFAIGAYGVDLFFVISGFIMYTVARDEPVGRFLDRRLSRIYPLYWIATAFAVLCYWTFNRVHPSGTEVVQSLALWPHYSEAHRTQIWPILVPGWSLSYELYFYALFAIGLVGRRPALIPAFAIALAIGAGILLHPQSAPLRVMTNPILAEFVIGLLVARLAAAAPGWLLPIGAAAALGGTGLLGMGHSALAVGAFAGSLVGLTVVLEAGGRLGNWALPRILGDASYAIYLFHSPILLLVERTATPANAAGLGAMGAAFAAIGGTIALCTVLHFVLEKPLLRATHHFSRRLATLIAAQRGGRSDPPPGAAPE